MTTLELLEKRVSALELEVEGEKVVTRYILEQTRRNGDDLAALRTRVDRIEKRLDSIEARLTRVEQEIASLRQDLAGLRSLPDEMRSLRKDLPGIVAETLREVLRERGSSAP